MSKARARKKNGAAAADAQTATDTASASTTVASAAPPNSSSGSAAAPTATESLKDQGNRAFSAGHYAAAVDHFSHAIDLMLEASDAALPAVAAQAGVDAKSMHLLYSNRSAAHLALQSFPAALADADRVTQLKPEWAKGHFRRGAALEGLLQFQEAADAYTEGLKCDPADPTLRKSSAELAALLSELKLTERQLASSRANPDADRFDLMVRWLREGGAKFPRLYLQYYSEDYRGVHSLSRIPAEEIVLYVPMHMIMTSQVAMEAGIGKQIVDAGVELRSKHSYLACYLLQERAKGKESYWEPYVSALPRVYANMPIFFDQKLLDMLKGSFTLGKIQDRAESLKAEYHTICAAVPALAAYTLDDFIWARLAVITRIFGLVIRGVKTDGLVAYADMLNHKKPQNAADTDTRWTFDDNLNGFTITSTRVIERGAQVYDSYGRKCNSRFFVNYGFALEDNEEDNEAVLRFACPPDTPNLALKTRLAGAAAGKSLLSLREFQVPASYRETSERELKGKEMLSFLRFVHATDAELMMMQHQSSIAAGAAAAAGAPAGAEAALKLDSIDPITTRLESVVLQHVQRSARAALAAFDTTLEEDNALLAATGPAALAEFSNERNCVLQRRGEKQVLRWWDNLATTALPLLQMRWADLRKLAPRHMSNSARDHYITHCVAVLVKRGA